MPKLALSHRLKCYCVAGIAALLVVTFAVAGGLGSSARGAGPAGVEAGHESAGVVSELAHLRGEAHGQPVQGHATYVTSESEMDAISGPMISSLSSATTRTYRAANGSFLTKAYRHPVNFRNQSGQWQTVDTRLVRSAAGWKNAANAFGLSLPASLTGPVSLQSGSASLAFRLVGAKGTGSASGATASYSHVLPSVSVSYDSLSSGVRELITLQGRNAPRTLRFAISAHGLRLTQASHGAMTLLGPSGRVRFRIPGSVAWAPTQGGIGTREVSSSLSRAGHGWILSLSLSSRWLRRALATGDVIVDPSVEYGASEKSGDAGNPSQACTLKAATPTTSYCNPVSKLSVGGEGSSSERALLGSLPSVPRSRVVLNAWLNVDLTHRSTTNCVKLGVYRVTRPWTTAATWDTYDGTHAWSKAGGDYAEGGDSVVMEKMGCGEGLGVYQLNITQLAQEWENGEHSAEGQGYAADGLMLAEVPNSGTNNLEFAAAKPTEGEAPEYLMSWLPNGEGEKSQFTMLPMSLTSQMSLAVNAASGNLVAHSQDLSIPGRGLDFAASRVYNSATPWQSEFGNWQDSNQPGLRFTADGNTKSDNLLLYRDSTGAWFQFFRNGNNYITPPGIKATLCRENSTSPCKALPAGVSYRLTYNESQVHIDFNHFGAPVDVEDQYGNKLTSNGGQYAPFAWTDTEGREIAYTKEHKVVNQEEEKSNPYTSIADVAGKRTAHYTYTSAGSYGPQLTEYTDVDGGETHYEYKGAQLSSITTPRGEVIKISYVGSGANAGGLEKIIRTTNAQHTTGPTWTFTYYEVGKAPAPCTSSQKATVVKDPDGSEGQSGHTTTYCANSMNEVEKAIDASGHETKAAFDPFANMTSSTAAAPGTGEEGGVESFDFDSVGMNLKCAVTASSVESSCPSKGSSNALTSNYSYTDAASPFSATQSQNPQFKSTFACYNGGEYEGDAQKEIIGTECPKSSTGPNGSLENENDQLSSEHLLEFAHNSAGQLTAATDADGHVTEFQYEKGNLSKVVPPVGSGQSATTITDDADSRPHIIVDGDGRIETITYNGLNEVIEIVYSGTGTASTVKFERDPDGNIIKREDSTGTTKYTVDPLDRITKEELPGGLSNAYEWDPASNVIAFTDSGGTTKYKINGLNETESMTEPGESESTLFGHNNDHGLTKITYPSGATENFKLDAVTGRPESITAEGVTGTTVPNLSYVYKQGSNDTALVQSVTESTGNTSAFEYDPLERVISAVSSGTGPNQSRYVFSLDGAGNRTQQTVNPTGSSGGATTYYSLNAGNELLCRQTVAPPCNISSELSGYSYDPSGDETAITPEGEASGSTLGYDAADQMSTLTPTGSGALSLGYQGSGQGDLVAVGSATTLQNSELGITREVGASGTSYYARTPDGLLIDERTPTGHYNPLYDAQGDIIALVNSTGKVERTFHYGPYGENVKSEGTQTIPDPFLYKGGYHMPGGNAGLGNVPNGLYHFGERYYDPTTGRWTQQDPEDQLGSVTEADRFQFTGDDPINVSDSSGESGDGCGGGGYCGGVWVEKSNSKHYKGEPIGGSAFEPFDTLCEGLWWAGGPYTATACSAYGSVRYFTSRH